MDGLWEKERQEMEGRQRRKGRSGRRNVKEKDVKVGHKGKTKVARELC